MTSTTPIIDTKVYGGELSRDTLPDIVQAYLDSDRCAWWIDHNDYPQIQHGELVFDLESDNDEDIDIVFRSTFHVNLKHQCVDSFATSRIELEIMIELMEVNKHYVRYSIEQIDFVD